MTSLKVVCLCLIGMYVLLIQNGEAKFCYKPSLYYVSVRRCWVNAWGWCVGTSYTSVARYRNKRYCCPGYKGDDCATPVCVPPCLQGGKCIAPNECECPVQAQGDTCQEKLCSHLTPCFPGNCTTGDNCTCQDGFEGDSCLNMTGMEAPSIYTFTTNLYNIRRGDGKELYRYSTDGADLNNTNRAQIWSKEQDYNYVTFNVEALFDEPYIDIVPNYVGNFSLGVSKATVNLVLTKISRVGSAPISVHDQTYDCSDSGYSDVRVTKDEPVTGVLKCTITNPNFALSIEHGDNFTITAEVGSGGFRDLIDRNDDTIHDREYFTGTSVKKSLLFQFDFRKPYHCQENGSCSDSPLEIMSDVTKEAINFRWSGWMDDLSQIYRYTWEVHKLNPERFSRYLVEPEPMRPINHTEIMASGYTPGTMLSYTPEEPGVYSLILEVADKANNSIFARQVFIYDPVSNVTLNEDAKCFASSANVETSYMWQNNVQGENDTGFPVDVTWKNRFANKLHEQREYLNQVDTYPEAILETGHGSKPTRVVKAITSMYDDHGGKRTLTEIPNAHGIVDFKVAYKTDHEGGVTIQSMPDEAMFVSVMDPLSQNYTFNSTRMDGDTMHVWVKGIDILGNENIDDFILHFDSSPPVVHNVTMERNTNNGTFMFTSRINVDGYDEHSGIHKVGWKVIGYNETVLHEGENVIQEANNCSNSNSSIEDCTCIPMGNCFFVLNSFDFDHCMFAVEKTNIKNKSLILQLDVFNTAMLSASVELEIDDLLSFNGIDEYTGIRDLHIARKTTTSLTLEWENPPSCYGIKEFSLVVRSSDGKSTIVTLPGDLETYTITGLDPNTNYEIEFNSKYGPVSSEITSIKTTTQPQDSTFSTAAIAGVSAVVLILLGIIIIGVILLRTGQLEGAKQKAKKRISRYIIRPITTYNMKFSRRTGVYSGALDEDIYALGNIIMENDESWLVSFDDVILKEKIKSGHFADIYSAVFNNETVVAKLMKKGYSEEDSVVMKAKINYFASQTLEHENVLKFMGAVLNHPQFGAYMLLEYCEEGSLLSWLKKHRGKVNEDVIEKMCNITFGVAKGMAYLSSNQIVHRRLGARNVYLKADLEPKIAGLGPTPELKEGEDADETGKEKIPVKWTAVELLKGGLESATSAADVWSFGILIWEMFSVGEEPYPGIRNKQVLHKIISGYRMQRPEFCPEQLGVIMSDCWLEHPGDRPTFDKMAAELERLYSSYADYI